MTPVRDILITVVVLGLLPVCLARPWIGILVWSWLGYMNPHRLTWGFAYNLPFAQMAAIATLAGLIFTRDRRPLPRASEVYLLLGLWATFLLSTMFSLYPDDAWLQFAKVSKILFMTLVTIVLCRGPKKVKALIWVIALSIGFFGLKGGIWAVLTGGQNQVLGPPQSFIEGNTEIGLALNMVVPLLVFLRRQESRPWIRHVLAVCVVFSIIAIVFTYSRGAFLGLAVVLALLIVRSRAKMVTAIVLAVGLLVINASLPEKWVDRMETITTYEQDNSAMARLTAWRVAYHLALDHPLLGGGFRTFTVEVYDQYEPGWGLDTDAHNVYLQVLGEHGFTGLAIYVALIASTMISLRRLMRKFRRDPTHRWVHDCAQMLEVSLAGYLVSGMFLSLSYFDLFYHLVAVTVILKALFLTQDREPESAAVAASPRGFVGALPRPWPLSNGQLPSSITQR